jgi:hypothetical protein
VKATEAPRPTDRTVTKESNRMFSPRRHFFLLSFAIMLVFGTAAASAVAAETSPWLNLTVAPAPSILGSAIGSEGELGITATDVGTAPIEAQSSPVLITVTLPSGLEATAIGPFFTASGPAIRGVTCELASLTCEYAGSMPLYEPLEVFVSLKTLASASSGEVAHVSVTAPGAPGASVDPTLAFGDGPPPFGIDSNRFQIESPGGGPATQAGSHPFQTTSDILLDRRLATNENEEIYPISSALPKDVAVKLPPGFLGDPSPLPTCSLHLFLTIAGNNEGSNECPPETAVGVASVLATTPNQGAVRAIQPVFNLEPGFGEPARLGFYIRPTKTPVLLDASLRSGPGEDYGITLSTQNIIQTGGLVSSEITIWGTPGDPRHDTSRGYGCLTNGFEFPCQLAAQKRPPAFLTMPTSCTGAPLPGSIAIDSWARPTELLDSPFTPQLPTLDGCNRLPFAPTLHSEPTSSAATSPTGLEFDLGFEDEGLLNSEGLAQSQLKKAVVTLPEGFTTNPSVAEGLKACGLAEYEAATVQAGTGCTPESKVGEVEIESPLVEGKKVLGGLYVARQGENPYHNLLTLYLIARNEELGVLVRQALKVIPNPVTGQLTTEVDNVPQLPFSKFHLQFRSGQRSPLITPPACGPYAVKAKLYPYSDPTEALERESSFQITQGPEGLGCPSGGVPPFHPGLEAGTINNAAGTYSPFYTHITRKDSEQEITRFSIKLPTGLIAKLKGVSECSDAGVAAAKAREKEGGATEEEASPSCPSNSEVGTTKVGTGVGNVLAYAGGKLYLAGPYHGSPISLVSINDAKVGPFDLGTVVVRFALDVNHETAEVSVDGANSDPIPHIVDGIPIHLRDIRAYVDRPGFTLNPTSCAKKSTAATVLGSGQNFASSSDDVPVTVSSPFQAADCASLGFAPKLALNLVGKKTHRGALPAFKAVLTYPKGGAYANIAKAQVTLPGSEFLEQGHLKNVCTRKVFETGKNPGENCPKNSIYGTARATTPLLEQPLEGPVYLRTGYGTKLPELAAALNGPQISITLAGTIDSVHKKGSEGSQIRNTFALVPDAPVEKFTLELRGGKKGLLVNSTDVCKGTHKALAAFTGQNGKLDEYEPELKAQCGKSGGKKKSGGNKKGSKGKGGK